MWLERFAAKRKIFREFQWFSEIFREIFREREREVFKEILREL